MQIYKHYLYIQIFYKLFYKKNSYHFNSTFVSMSSARGERLRKVFDYLVFSGVFTTRADFAEAIGVNKTNLSSAMNGNEKYLSDSLFSKIHSTYNNINLQWLLSGDGEMLKVPATVTVFNPTPEERKDAEGGMDLSVVPAEIVEEIKEEVREEIREEVIAEITKAESVPYVPSRIANNIQVENIREYLEKKGDELERIKPGDLVGDPDSAERIRKTSMSPTFIPGDVVFVQFLDNIKNITDGQIYYFKMATRPTMIRRVKIEGDYLRLVADNPNFGDIITSFDEIVNVADIVGMFRSSFGNQYAEVEAVRAKKEQQIDNLIDEIRDYGKRTGRVMEQNYELMQKLMEKLLEK